MRMRIITLSKRQTPCEQSLKLSNKELILADQAEQLSKREQLAAIDMQALITANTGKSSYATAETAVNHADALIKALNTNKQA